MRTAALWIGGPPGQTLIRIKDKLAADGIDVTHVQEHFTGNLPAVAAVLINIDMLDHTSFEAGKAAAKAAGIPFAAVRTDYSRTRLSLQAAGMINPETKEADMASTATARNVAPNFNNPEEIKAFLSAIPASMRAYAVDELSRIARASVVEPAVDAFHAMCENAPAGQRADAVADFVSHLDPDFLAELKSALRGH